MTTGAVQPFSQSETWCFQDAKARFGEVAQRACTEGPQCVIVPGQDAVVIISAAEFRRLTGPVTGQALIDAHRHRPSAISIPNPSPWRSRPATPVSDAAA
ncbi:type II toxin-antitoxin system prevent-host-death family antitoxin [Methylobacterium sp. J-001]|uniref:type II toxin-antitoxin system prevent-host-death family antitoxin n=1 Tax=Methylobacterium sp. J-001 TaxID=2836609 RepID=UPI001FBA40DD|nr:type II toxin-antitoxin system prevent-host-death family antitoxin [Methylobacterium sp. J-001]MCJ2118874.1 type II toxin-antitoxin system prevent-host-death family antitoxin [Methylobacterium sp. J-001]